MKNLINIIFGTSGFTAVLDTIPVPAGSNEEIINYFIKCLICLIGGALSALLSNLLHANIKKYVKNRKKGLPF